MKKMRIYAKKDKLLGRAPYGVGTLPLHPQLMLWFTYYKGTFSTFVFASQNRAFMLRSVLCTLRPSMRLTQTLTSRCKNTANRPPSWLFFNHKGHKDLHKGHQKTFVCFVPSLCPSWLFFNHKGHKDLHKGHQKSRNSHNTTSYKKRPIFSR
jgi:hypothetical protein